MAETIHVRGEGGGIFAMTLPLHPAIQQRLDAGAIVRVSEDGTALAADAKPATARRKPAAKPPAK